METALLRTVSSTQSQPLSRTPEAVPDAVKTDLPADQNVQATADSRAAVDKDGRAQSESVRSQMAATEKAKADTASVEARRRMVDRDAKTGLYVVRIIEQRNGQTVDQIPSDAYLRMKANLRDLLQVKSGGDTPPHSFDTSA